MDIPTFSSILSCNHSLFQYTQFPHLWQEQKHSIGCNRPQNITGGCNHLSLSSQFILSHLIVKNFNISARQTIQQPHLSQPLHNFILHITGKTQAQKKLKMFHVKHFQFFLTYLYPFFQHCRKYFSLFSVKDYMVGLSYLCPSLRIPDQKNVGHRTIFCMSASIWILSTSA